MGQGSVRALRAPTQANCNSLNRYSYLEGLAGSPDDPVLRQGFDTALALIRTQSPKAQIKVRGPLQPLLSLLNRSRFRPRPTRDGGPAYPRRRLTAQQRLQCSTRVKVRAGKSESLCKPMRSNR